MMKTRRRDAARSIGAGRKRGFRTIVIGETPITIEHVVSAARCGADIRFAPSVAVRLECARAIVERFAAGEAAVYGLNTGLGAAVDTRLSEDDIADFQRRAVMARAVGIGEVLSVEEVRATLFVRLVGIAQGASGLSPAFMETVGAMLEKGLHPRVRRIGTLGQSDLSPLAQLFLPLAGGGEAEFGGRLMPGPEALRRAGITAPPFGPKDGIALINSNAFAVGLAALTLHELGLALEALTVAGALSLEAFRANLSPIDARLVALRAAPGQAELSACLRALLAGSDLTQPGRARRVQDPLSFRCLAPVHGAALEQLRLARTAVEADLNGAGDSPAVLVVDGELLSSVNFDTTAIALACQGLSLAAAHAAAIAVFRIAKLMSPGFSDLPRFLTRHGGSRAGFATVQKAASALEAEIRHLALPVGPMAAPVADGVEDYAPMTPRVVENARDIGRRLMRLAAIELVVAAQAVDLRDGIGLGRGTRRAHAFVRDRVPALDDDRPTGGEFELLAAAIAAGDLAAAVARTKPR